MAETANQKAQRSTKRVWPRMGEIILLVIAAFCILVLLTQDLGLVTRFFYSPLAIILLIVVFVEYLIIKGGDRSRLYLIELERMREREQEHVARTRRALEEIHRAIEGIHPSATPSEGSGAPLPPVAVAEECLKRVEHLLRPDVKE